MTNRSWALCIPALLFSAAVHAQSSVTLYGIIDEGLDYTSNVKGSSAYQMKSGNLVGSRWGMSGKEDLGGGLSAIFQLESGFNASTGALGQEQREFGRRAYVGLSSTDYGTLTLGRQYDPTIDMFADLTTAGNWGGDVGSAPYDNDNADFDYRISNSVKYRTPTYRGLTGEVMYGFSNTAGGFADNRLIAAAGQYKNNGLTAEVAYMRIDNPGVGSSGALTSDSIFTAATQEDIDAAIGYRFSKALIAFAYSHTRVGDPTANSYLSGSLTPANGGTWTGWTFDNFQINGQYFFKPNFWLGASYTYTLGKLDTTAGNYSPKWHAIALMLDYDLSARTSVYLQGGYQHVDSAHTGTEFDDAEIVAGAGVSSTENQMFARVAMIHHF